MCIRDRFRSMFQAITLVEMPVEILREHTPHLPVDAVHALRVGELHRRFAVGVFAYFGLGMDHPCLLYTSRGVAADDTLHVAGNSLHVRFLRPIPL